MNPTATRQQTNSSNPYQLTDNDFKAKASAFGAMTSTTYPLMS